MTLTSAVNWFLFNDVEDDASAPLAVVNQQRTNVELASPRLSCIPMVVFNNIAVVVTLSVLGVTLCALDTTDSVMRYPNQPKTIWIAFYAMMLNCAFTLMHNYKLSVITAFDLMTSHEFVKACALCVLLFILSIAPLFVKVKDQKILNDDLLDEALSWAAFPLFMIIAATLAVMNIRLNNGLFYQVSGETTILGRLVSNEPNVYRSNLVTVVKPCARRAIHCACCTIVSDLACTVAAYNCDADWAPYIFTILVSNVCVAQTNYSITRQSNCGKLMNEIMKTVCGKITGTIINVIATLLTLMRVGQWLGK